jgi:hypothetical protein
VETTEAQGLQVQSLVLFIGSGWRHCRYFNGGTILKERLFYSLKRKDGTIIVAGSQLGL